MSRYDRTVRGGFTAVLLLLGVCVAAQASAAPADALMPVEKYTTAKAKNLANAHRLRLIEFSEQIYNCMPWLAVYPGRIGFPRYKDSPSDDRYLSTWIWVDQREDPVFAALPQERRASAMFSRYGVDMMRRMAALSDVVDDGDVAGLKAALRHDPRGVDVEHTGLAPEDDQPVGGAPAGWTFAKRFVRSCFMARWMRIPSAGYEA